MERRWEVEYVDLGSRYLSDDDREWLYTTYPGLPDSSDDGCPTCQGRRMYVWRGEEVHCDCRQQLTLHKHYLNANIGLLYQRLNWDDFVANDAVLQDVYGYLNRHEHMVRAGIGATFLGPVGTGKTMLVSLMAKAFVRLGYSVWFTTFAAVIEMFTSGWRSEEERRRFERRVVQSDVLVLDDVGKEFRTKTNLAESTFDHILRQRVIALRPTLLTSNMTRDELAEGYGRAVLSLLVERSGLEIVDGPDWREEAQRRTIDEVLKGWQRPIF